MITQFRATGSLAVALLAAAALVESASAQTRIGYGVNAEGVLFRFNLDVPNNPVIPIGPVAAGAVPIFPEGIDFRPTTTAGDVSRPLYAIDIGEVTTQLYIVNTTTAAATAVGPGFPSVVAGSYNLATSNSFGFDFNPVTLQGDGSIRIRLVGTSGVNLRLNSDTGLVAAVDGPETYAGGGDPNGTGAGFVDAVAYINSDQAILTGTPGATTTLFAMDSRTDDTSIQNPPNNGTLNTVGEFGILIDGLAPMSFDILTDRGSTDGTLGGDRGYAVYRRSNAPIGSEGSYLLYNVNLTTGATTGGALVGIGGPIVPTGGEVGPADFTGGLAVLAVPEPFAAGLAVLAAVACWGLSGRRRIRP